MLTWLLARASSVTGVLALALVIALGVAMFEHSRAKHAAGLLSDARDSIQRQALAINSKESAIKSLEQALGQWQALITPSADVTAAAKRAGQAASTIEAAAKRLHTNEVVDHALPECAALLSADIGAVCPSVASGVRERADYRLP